MKPLWFIGGMLVAAALLVGIGVAAAYSGGAADSKLQPAVASVDNGGCGCGYGATAGGCGAAGCTAGCGQCKGGCGAGCRGGCTK